MTLDEMLAYYGFETLEEFGIEFGFYNNTDAERFLTQMYEEDKLWD